MLVAPTAFEFGRSFCGTLSDDAMSSAEAVFEEMEADGLRMLAEATVASDEITFQRSADMRYVGQNRELTVPLPARLEGDAVESLRQLFYEHYRRLYGHAHTDVEVQLVTCRLVASSPHRVLANRTAASGRGEARKGVRQVYFDAAGGYAPTIVYDRYHLAAGFTLDGPAVLEERESTAVVPPGATATIDDELNLVIELGG
jgi:N-methylhydantoinase A